MESSNLPEDLIEEILSRVPAKPLARLQSISKRWNTRLKSRSFAKKHYANAPKESLMIMLLDFRVYTVSANLSNNVAPSFKVASQFYLKDPKFKSSQVDIRNVFHCDGLLLCTTKDNRLVVWNPCSGETKWIKPRNHYKKSKFYALGYDNKSSCKQYKVLRIDRQCRDLIFYNEYEIYDFISDSWKVLGATDVWFLFIGRRGISVKGDTYWIADDISQDGPNPEFLLSFDFSTERFQSLSLPHPFRYLFSALSVVRVYQLCMLGICNSGDLHVWLTTRTGSSVISWSKFISVKANIDDYSFGMSFFVDEQTKLVVCCIKSIPKKVCIVGENKYILVDHHGGDSKRTSLLLTYVPTLAQIQLGGCKRKAPST